MAGNRSQPFKVEEGIFDPKRVKGPLDALDARLQSQTPLFQLDRPSQALIPVPGENPQRQGVEIAPFPIPGGQPVEESYHPVLRVEGSQDRAPDLVHHNEAALRVRLVISKSKDALLQSHESLKFPVSPAES